MGVLGLTTFVREHERTLGKTTKRELNSSPESIVVDGWSFIYNLAHSVQLPWAYGGEYLAFSQAVNSVVQAFLDVGLYPHFVFDGALHPSKFATRIKRCIQNNVRPAQLFFRTSNYARSSPRFLAENHIQPPLYYLATLEALNAFKSQGKNVYVHMADDDADKFAVELAGKLGAFCLSNDSDYIILNCEGYKGYIQFDDLKWDLPPPAYLSSTPLSLASPSSDGGSSVGMLDFDDLGFKTVTKSKSRRKKKQVQIESVYGLVPPENFGALSFTSFHPSDLAAELKLPISMLPLVASLIGNDFSDQAVSGSSGGTGTSSTNSLPNKIFFEARLPASERTARVATVLNSILNPRKGRTATIANGAPELTGMELISKAVEKLLLRPDLVGGREREKLVDVIVESVLMYAVIPSLGPEEGEGATKVCDLHSEDICPLYFLDAVLANVDDDDTGIQEETERSRHMELLSIRDVYINAYRQAKLLPNVLNIVGSGTYWAHGMLEDPDRECCERSVGGGIRRFIYAVLGNSMGVGVALDREEELEGENAGEDEDEDELIDVVEEDSEDEEREEVEKEEEEEGEEEEEDVHEQSSRRVKESVERAKSRDAKRRVSFAAELEVEPGTEAPVLRSFRKSGKKEAESTNMVVSEYIRRGVRVTDVLVEVDDSFETMLKLKGESDETFIQLLPDSDRFAFFLNAMGSHIPALSPNDASNIHLPPEMILHVVCIRWVVKTMGERSNTEERWTKREAECLLAALITTHPPSSSNASSKEQGSSSLDSLSIQSQSQSQQEQDTPVELVNRNIQLTAQYLSALSNVIMFIQVMLLTDDIPTSVLRFSGKQFHRLLTDSSITSITNGEELMTKLGLTTKDEEQLFERCWKVCEEGLETFWGVERTKGKRGQKKAQNQSQGDGDGEGQTKIASALDSNAKAKEKSNGVVSSRSGAGFFTLLADVDGDVDA